VSELLVIGFGYLGQAIAKINDTESLWARVIGLRRNGGLDALTADVANMDSLQDARHACPTPSAIVYCVAPGGGGEAAYEATYEQGLKNVLETWPQARLALVSSTVVYGGDSSDDLDDFTEPQPNTPSAESVLRGESLALKHSPLNLVVRASGIYGPGRVGLLRRLITEELAPDDFTRVTSRIHVHDLARIVLTLLASRETYGAYVATDPTPTPLGEVQTTVRAHPAASLLSQLGPPGLEVRTRRSRSSRRIVPRRLLDLGFPFEFPSFREGYHSILDSYLQRTSTGHE
jgi:nucleoside-diphosphate-sugar epimerase